MHIDCLTRMKVLMEEVQILRGRLQQHDTGHIATAINVLEVLQWLQDIIEVSSNHGTCVFQKNT